jgi:DNA polymerase-3 subunit delta
MPKIHAAEVWIRKISPLEARIIVLTGEEPFWKTEVLREVRELVGGQSEESTLAFRRLDGNSLSWADLAAEVETPSLFGSRQLVAVEDADNFISRHQKELLHLMENPPDWGLLLFSLKSLATNSRLGRVVIQRHLWIDCSLAALNLLLQWLPAWAGARCGLRLSPAAAKTLVDLVGENPGLLDQQLRKLALEVDGNRTVTPQHVARFCERWRIKNAWAIIDLALEGRAAEALQEIDRLLAAGEHPLAILGQIGGMLRRLSQAAALVVGDQAAAQKLLPKILSQLGVPPAAVAKTITQLRQLGIRHARALAQVLLSADLQLKGGSVLEGRVVLERLVLWLANPAARKAAFSLGDPRPEVLL